MKVVYVAHPLGQGSDREPNRARAARWVGWVADCGHAPVADWIILSGVWTEDRREEGLAIDCALVARCDELWLVGGRVSPGMRVEADAAERAGVRVVDLTHLGEEPPTVRQLGDGSGNAEVVYSCGAPVSATNALPDVGEPCPACGGELDHGYGLEGGGMGAYAFCSSCDFFAKVQDPEVEVPPMKVKLLGDWAKTGKIVETMGKRFSAAAEKAMMQEAHFLRGKMVQNITSGGALAGKPFAPLSSSTLAIRRFTGFGGTKILMRTGALRGAIVVRRVGKSVFVGVQRRAAGGANIAEVHEYGASISMVMTDRQRRFLMAALRNSGAPSPGKGGGVLVIKIPARPFIGPVVDKFAQPEDVRKRFWASVSKSMGGDFGK